jgi:hypothetical protein
MNNKNDMILGEIQRVVFLKQRLKNAKQNSLVIGASLAVFMFVGILAEGYFLASTHLHFAYSLSILFFSTLSVTVLVRMIGVRIYNSYYNMKRDYIVSQLRVCKAAVQFGRRYDINGDYGE